MRKVWQTFPSVAGRNVAWQTSLCRQRLTLLHNLWVHRKHGPVATPYFYWSVFVVLYLLRNFRYSVVDLPSKEILVQFPILKKSFIPHSIVN